MKLPIKGLIKKVSLEPLKNNINRLCSPELLQQPLPQTQAIITEIHLTRVFRTCGMVKMPASEDL